MTQIRDFEGFWEVTEDGQSGSHNDKDSYYPPPGTVIELWIKRIESKGRKRVIESALKAKVVCIPDGKAWGVEEEFEKATFFFNEGKLISTPIKVEMKDPDSPEEAPELLRIVEYSTLSDNGSRMTNFLYWSDSDSGRWGCVARSAPRPE